MRGPGPGLVGAAALAALYGCTRSGFAAHPCGAVDCNGQGTCIATAEGEPRCVCDPGFSNEGPLSCVQAGVVVDGGRADQQALDGAGADLAPTPDGAAPDAAATDGALLDGAASDVGAPDSALPDVTSSDAARPDTEIPDSGMIVLPDVQVRDVVGPDAADGGQPDLGSAEDAGRTCDASCTWGCNGDTCDRPIDLDARRHYCVLMRSGAIYCWGSNTAGEVGDGTTIDRDTPVRVLGVSDAISMGAGGAGRAISGGHTCAVRPGGQVLCWGGNLDGQLGDGTNEDSLTPVQAVGIADATAVDTNGSHTCAIHTTGAISCWGSGAWGQLGNGASAESNVPVPVRNITNAVQLAVGLIHTCARLADGTVACWGANDFGQLGDRTGASSRSSPASVYGVTDAIDAAAGDNHTCAVRADNTVVCWGRNAYGELGDGTIDQSNEPVVAIGIADALSVSAGEGSHSCAVRSTGGMYCWGDNDRAQLGDGTSQQQLAPVSVLDMTDASQAGAGFWITFVITGSGDVLRLGIAHQTITP